MRILVTGAAGFVGAALVRRLLDDPARHTVLALDLAPPEAAADSRLVPIAGSFGDPEVLAGLGAAPPDLVFHLASVPGGAAEANYALGAEVNVHATLRLMQAAAGWGDRPRFVFASSIAVFGAELPPAVDDDTPPRPSSSYGAQKQIGEILLSDLLRRGELSGCSVRLPGIVCRPPQRTGAVSIFMSDLIRDLPAGGSVVCPVPPEGTIWWMSVGRCVDNLLAAARPDAPRGPGDRGVFTFPALRATVGEVVDALAARHGAGLRERVSYRPDPAVTRLFASFPPLRVPASEAAGLRSDGTVEGLLDRA